MGWRTKDALCKAILHTCKKRAVSVEYVINVARYMDLFHVLLKKSWRHRIWPRCSQLKRIPSSVPWGKSLKSSTDESVSPRTTARWSLFSKLIIVQHILTILSKEPSSGFPVPFNHHPSGSRNTSSCKSETLDLPRSGSWCSAFLYLQAWLFQAPCITCPWRLAYFTGCNVFKFTHAVVCTWISLLKAEFHFTHIL